MRGRLAQALRPPQARSQSTSQSIKIISKIDGERALSAGASLARIWAGGSAGGGTVVGAADDVVPAGALVAAGVGDADLGGGGGLRVAPLSFSIKELLYQFSTALLSASTA